MVIVVTVLTIKYQESNDNKNQKNLNTPIANTPKTYMAYHWYRYVLNIQFYVEEEEVMTQRGAGLQKWEWQPGKKCELFQEIISKEQKWEGEEGGEWFPNSNYLLKIPTLCTST